jgi:hypothetical protein
VLWVAFGLVSLALYFGHASSLELRAADHRAAAVEAEQAIAGAARYAAYVVTNLDNPGVISDLEVSPTREVVREGAGHAVDQRSRRTHRHALKARSRGILELPVGAGRVSAC